MTHALEATGWVAYTSDAIYGVGDTRDAAMEDGRQWLADELGTDPEVNQDLSAGPATAALMRQLQEPYGERSMHIVDGVCCTSDEASGSAIP